MCGHAAGATFETVDYPEPLTDLVANHESLSPLDNRDLPIGPPWAGPDAQALRGAGGDGSAVTCFILWSSSKGYRDDRRRLTLSK